ncbi:hypothetical protein [Mycoplasma enhydrae]|uniref:hypothetical protein n=1 Tax=Mycoplasma enhydrae TaxID=2499220 RepID=UPI00197C0DA1|nr:hypothetical protein [Mycoplasma enhydrae]MBN4089336.1 hypothetical protein [Mycoplasma enhydrae]
MKKDVIVDPCAKMRKICYNQYILGASFLVILSAFIGVLLAIYLPDFEINKSWTSNFSYIFIAILFAGIIFAIILNSAFGFKLAKEMNDKKLSKYFIFSIIFIIPFLSLYSIFASATLLKEKLLPKPKKPKKSKNKVN